MIAGQPWWQAVGYALSGAWADGPAMQQPRVGAVLDWLQDSPISRDDIERARAGHPADWPFALPADVAARLSASQFASLLQATRDAMGLGTPPPVVRHPSAPLDAHDRSLIEDRPPHHG